MSSQDTDEASSSSVLTLASGIGLSLVAQPTNRAAVITGKPKMPCTHLGFDSYFMYEYLEK
jgi:hypothetical protein